MTFAICEQVRKTVCCMTSGRLRIQANLRQREGLGNASRIRTKNVRSLRS